MPAISRISIPRLAALLLIFLASAAQAQDSLRLHGSNVLGERMVPLLVENWMRGIGYGGIKRVRTDRSTLHVQGARDGETLDVEIVGNGSGAGFADLVEGEAEIAMMARPLTAKERDDGWQLGQIDSGDQESVVALQALVVVVHPDNPLRSLSRSQVAAIVSGKIRDWREVGGRPGPIHAQLAAPRTALAEMQGQMLAASLPGQKHGDAHGVMAAVAADAQAIGIVEFGNKLAGVRALPLRVGGRDIAADRLNVLTEDYPLSRRLVFRTGQLVTALGRGFVNYVVSTQGQSGLAKAGYLALSPTAFARPDLQGAPRDYAALVDGAARLSLNFRFGNTLSLFDSRSEQDMARLHDFLAQPAQRGRKLILVGLSGRESSPFQSILLSNDRADLVAEALDAAGVVPARVRGMGYQRPLTEDAGAQASNLRVEVWLR